RPHHAHPGNPHPAAACHVRRHRRPASWRPPLMHASARTLARLLIGLAGLSALAGCGVFVVGGAAATSALVATDRRTAGEQLDDQTIELRVDNALNNAFGDKARTSSMSYAGRVLLVGDVPTEADRQQAATLAQGV